MKKMTLTLITLLVGAMAWGAPKYTGSFLIKQGGMHKEDISGSIALTFTGEQLTKVALKTTAPVMGKTDFESAEQFVFSNTSSNPPQMAVIYKLKGPPHKWYYTFVTTTTDQGKTFAGTIYKGTASVDDLKKALDAGTIGTYKNIGSGSLNLSTAAE